MKERILERWGLTRPKLQGRVPLGYVEVDGKFEIVPEIVLILDEGLDQLDAGIALRPTLEWINSKLKDIDPSLSLSHMGLQKVWDRERPNHPRKFRKVNNTRELNAAEKLERKRRYRIAQEKRSIKAAQKRIERLGTEIEIIKKNDDPIIEIPLDLDTESNSDFKSVLEEANKEDIIFKPNEGPQTAFLAATEQEVLYGGAAGGGKSFAMLADPLRYFGNPKFNGLLLRRTNDELRKLIMESHMLYPKAYPGAKWSEKKSLWTFPSGAQFWLTYLERDDDVLRYQGQDFCWIGIDELTQYATPFSWTYLGSRLRTTDPNLPLVMRATSNPGGPGHGWVKKMFFDPAPPGVAFDATDIDTGLPKLVPDNDPDFPEHMWGKALFRRRFIPAKLTDNPYIDWRYKANLLNLPEGQRRQLLEGDWTVADGAAFPEFRYNIHVVKPHLIPSNWKKFCSVDYGYSSYSAVLWFAINPSDESLVVYREIYVSKKTGIALAQLIQETEGFEDISYRIVDGSVWDTRGVTGPTIGEELQSTGLRFRRADKTKGSRSAGYQRLHELLKVNELTGKPNIVFFDTCRQIISDLPVIPAHPDGKDDIDDRYASDHTYDALRYGVMSRPKAFNVFDIPSNQTSFWRPADMRFGY